MLKRYIDLIGGVIVLLFAAVLFIATFSIRQIVGMTIGATFFPRVAAAILALLGTIIVVRGILVLRSAPKSTGEKKKFKLSEGALCTILTLGLFAIYALLMEPLGFLISTALYLFFQMIVLSPKEKRKYPLFAIISVVASVAIYFAFTKLFYLMLPPGILG
ncbi:MAG: tripartite tricarboxylate transporter TctB family protein [Pseudoflavonifractor sp.]